MKKSFTLLLAAALFLCGCTAEKTPATTTSATAAETTTVTAALTTEETTTTAITEEEVVEIVKRAYPDNAYTEIPKEYLKTPTENVGTIAEFIYDTRDNQTEGSPTFQKHALVYLPYGYDENDAETKYDVLYLMHGGSDSPEWFFGGVGKNTNLKKYIDNMIANGELKPLIICAVSYYTEYSEDATKNCDDFHYELMNDIIPVFEKTYHTYAEDVTAEGIAASRAHRAFGGFSMGAMTTWSVFINCLDSFKYFIPISGDCWSLGSVDADTKAKLLAEKVADYKMTSADFYIYACCGGKGDIANANLIPQSEAMKALGEPFVYCDNFADGNYFCCVNEKGGHDVNNVTKMMFNGLPKLFD